MSNKLQGQVKVHEEPALTAVVEISNSQGDIVDQVQVDAAGRYTYHLSSGDWSLRVWDAHGHRGDATVTVDGDTTLNFDLHEPEGGH